MASGAKGKGSKAAVWVILVLLIVGLAGFGATNFGGTIDTIGSVGDREISVQRYARGLQGQIQSFSAQTGTNLTLSQAQAFGLDRAVLQQLVSTAALENEAGELGLSAGDEQLRLQILQLPAFQDHNGEFDRDRYRFALQNAGISEKEFESDLRAEISRSLLQGAVAGGVRTPQVFVDTFMNFLGERRSFGFAAFVPETLETAIPIPNEADLRAYFDANPDDFMLPETRKITYAWVTPDMLIDTIEIDEAALEALYKDRIDEFVKPERRLVERLVLGGDADAARARLDAGEITFETLVAERGLQLADIDMGAVSEDDLEDGADAVFGATEPGIIGPVETDLGAALFRVNAILAAQETSFDAARPQLVDEFALDRARRVIGDQTETVDDLLAGGATLEELADETDLRPGQIDWTADTREGIAAYEGFRTAAAAAAVGDFPAVTELGDGGLFALRVDQVIEPRLPDFADARAQAAEDWRRAETAKALAAQAQAMADALKAGADPATLQPALTQETDITREGFVPDTPDDFLETVFTMDEGEIRVIEGDAAAYLVRLDKIAPPDADSAENRDRRAQLQDGVAQGVGADILQAYLGAVEARAGISLNQAAINAVHAQFP